MSARKVGVATVPLRQLAAAPAGYLVQERIFDRALWEGLFDAISALRFSPYRGFHKFCGSIMGQVRLPVRDQR